MATLLESIRDIIDRLLRLAVKLRSPETRLRSSRAANFEILDGDTKFFECFVEFDHDFVSSVFRQYRSGYKLADPDEIKASPLWKSKLSFDDEAPKYLVERIALANVARRRQFAYWKHHRLKLDKHTEAAVAVRRVTDLTSRAIDPETMTSKPTMTISTATQLLKWSRDVLDLESMASVSHYKPSTADEHSQAVIFPPPPQLTADLKFFECPYCLTTCARKTLEVKVWQAHLIRDLRPYICTYEDCRTPTQLYDTKASWIEHETTSHATSWKCPIHPNEIFDTQVGFQLHVLDGHVDRAIIQGVVQEDLPATSMTETTRSCPICTITKIPTAQYTDHVALHLERLAVFSLPRHASTDQILESEKDSDEANGDEAISTLDTKSELSFGSVPAASSRESDSADEDPPSKSSPAFNATEWMNLRGLTRDGVPPEPHPSVDIETVKEASPLPLHMKAELDRVERGYLRDIAIYQETVGPNHPFTLDTMERLSALYVNQQHKLQRAEKLLHAVVARKKKQLGEEDPETLNSLLDLARLLRRQNKIEHAELMFLQVVEAMKKVLGPTHSDTQAGMDELASVLKRKGKGKGKGNAADGQADV